MTRETEREREFKRALTEAAELLLLYGEQVKHPSMPIQGK